MTQKSEFTHGYALIVGVGADLPVTVDDAKGIRKIFCDPDRGGYQSEHVEMLLAEKTTRANILSGLVRLAEYARNDPEAAIVVYFSGHGGLNPYYHLVPWGYNPSDLSKTAISGSEFTEKLREIKSRKLLVLLDCCHAGGMADTKSTFFVKSPLPPEIDEILTSGSGRVVIASSRKDEVSYIGKPYSIFTQALREALSGYGAADWDGYCNVADIAMYVGRMVPNRSQDRQNPILKMSGADNFPVAYYAGGEKSPKKLSDSDGTIIPLDSLDPEIVSEYKKVLQSYQYKLLEIEKKLANVLNYGQIPEKLIQEKNLIIQEIREIEKRIQSDALRSGWQPPNAPIVNVIANGVSATAVNATNNSQITIHRHGSASNNMTSFIERKLPFNPSPDGTNIIADQDGSIAANADGQSKIEIDEE